MPYLQISPPTGPLNVFYSISTPLNHDADTIIPGLPTILFLHPVYMPQQIFESQFADCDLRKCNLITYDMRSHGETEGVIGDAKYLPAEDAYFFMEAVGLPPCHLFALSIGCCVALELASRYPDRILSMTLCSPISPVESEEVASGRLEVHEEWTNGTLLPGSVIEQMTIRAESVVAIESALEMDAIVGVKQLAFNNDMDELTSAIIESAIAQAQNHWLGTPQRSQEAYRSVIQWPLERKALTDKELAKIKAPTAIIHCAEDYVYPLDNAQSLEAQLKAAGVKVELYTAPGPHYGCVAGARIVNPIALNLVLSCHEPGIVSDVLVKAQTTGQMLKTPFQERLKKFDYLSFDPHEIQFFDSHDGLDTEQRTIPA